MFLSKQFGCYAFICMLDITIKVIPLIQREIWSSQTVIMGAWLLQHIYIGCQQINLVYIFFHLIVRTV
ncbi:hypothetical protein ERO13_A12G267550v2 [Gossypium hirsutum]|uniref:Uncharacterized protein n=4 Tax=Gossypium TaxID=3633 RepID=A0A5J5TGL3_GOSBA|nr:hypothetical protein ES319_A12G277200v1 [Gossypium barbadense]KAG4172341.1 hypothetical protein ERO13_A12G267550v2 [Gossypium hirsutum]TYG91931.1 hypothetical protein ES288_A12G302700v1 [Gossypium darwinii]TYH98346.1 hypothetical protein ES332_A12G303800v1 [Gossypium tomentosum]TYJ07238.1 hypothetical protein E1A91_A12G291300v1 [Gossypium mustelinum]